MENKEEMSKTTERPDSIKVSINAKKQASFEIKRYYNADETHAEHVIESMQEIRDKLEETFGENDGN